MKARALLSSLETTARNVQLVCLGKCEQIAVNTAAPVFLSVVECG